MRSCRNVLAMGTLAVFIEFLSSTSDLQDQDIKSAARYASNLMKEVKTKTKERHLVSKRGGENLDFFLPSRVRYAMW